MAFRELFWFLATLAWFLGSAAWTLFGFLGYLLMGILVPLVKFGGPITCLVGWVKMVRRLERDQPVHPLMQGTWDEWLGNCRPAILMIYFDTYGLDRNVTLMGAGLVATIPGLYFAGLLTDILRRM